MKWADIDLEAGYWRMPETKGRVPVVVPLVGPALAILAVRRESANGCPWVFPGHRRGTHLRDPRATWGVICRRAGLDDLHVHDLRRGLGSWMAGQNTSLQIIGKALGHRSPQATMVYARLSLDPVRQAVDQAATAMLLAGGQQHLLGIEPEDGDHQQG
jgi:integrase